jgi:hypothetical protein|tara:strand:- start:52 stop:420 length:369 start_codon:yes stop_codon:yes gene_type:complete
MSHFAEIDKDGVVLRVIVAEQDFINTGLVGDSYKWIQTSINTSGGVHYDQNYKPDDGLALRMNYAEVGGTYDKTRDAFIPRKDFDSWTLNEETCRWEPPTPEPIDKPHYWDESTTSWKEIPE